MKRLLLFILVLSSCAPVYIPNVRNSPMFTKAGEFQASAQLGNGLDLQSALSVSNQIGIMANYSYADRGSLDPNNPDEFHKHKLFEGGVGYFNNTGNVSYEFFVGYGKGEGSSYDQYEFFGTQSSAATGRFKRYFVQPAIGYNKSDFHFSFVPRIAIVDFYEFTNSLSGTALSINEDAKVFIEPAICSRANFSENRAFFTLQAGFSISASKNVYFEHRPFQFSFGLGLRIGGVKEYE